MTIAAGFVCTDGIVLSADTQFSNDTVKVSQTKVSVSDSKRCLVAVAGVDVLIDKAAEGIIANARQEMTLSDVEEVITDTLHELYVDYIDPTDQPGVFDVQVLVAVNAADGTALFKHSRWAVAPVKRYACIGTGAGLGTYIAERLFVSEAMPCISASIVAAYVLQVAKKYDTWCGKESEIFVLPKLGWAYEQSQGNIKQLEQYFDIVDTALRPLMLAIPDPRVDSDGIERLIQRFCEGVRAMRPFPFDLTVQITEGIRSTAVIGVLKPETEVALTGVQGNTALGNLTQTEPQSKDSKAPPDPTDPTGEK